MTYLQILNLFDEDLHKEILGTQKNYVKSLEDMLKHLVILETRNEEDAEPELLYIINFLEYLLKVPF